MDDLYIYSWKLPSQIIDLTLDSFDLSFFSPHLTFGSLYPKSGSVYLRQPRYFYFATCSKEYTQ